MAEFSVSAAGFAFLATMLREQCGLTLEPGKEYLLKSRLSPLAHKLGLTSLDQLIERLRRDSRDGLLTDVVEAMVTTETLFFRDLHPFETLKQTILPQLIERNRARQQLNIWCAASSSGQEPYSLAILLKEFFRELDRWRVHFVATDISQAMLRRSREGRYSQIEVNRGLPTPLLLKWFHQEGAVWQLEERIRTTIVFSQMNLIEPWPAMPAWDLILMRNVMIYFDTETKKTILGRVGRVLHPDGYLLLGGAETTFNLDDSLRRVESLTSGFYQRKPAGSPLRPS